MKYSEIKGEVSAELSKWTLITKNVVDLQSRVSFYENQLQNSNNSRDKKISEERDREFLKYQQTIAKPYQDGIHELENKKKLLVNKKDEVLKTLNEDEYRKKYRDRENLEEEKELCKELKDKTSTFYGEELQNSLHHLVEDRVASKDDLKNIIPMLNTLSTKTSDFSLDSLIDQLFVSFDYKEGDNEKVFATVSVSVVVFALLIYLYPLVILALALVSCYNLVKSHFFIKCISYVKSFEIHSSEIRNEISNYVKNKIEEDTIKIDKQFKESMKKIEKCILEVEQECDVELEVSKDSFVFNSCNVEKEFEDKKANLEDLFDMAKQNLKEEVAKEETSKKAIATLNEKLKDCLKTLYSEYYPNPMTAGTKLNTDYLLDIVEDNPSFFEYTNECSLFFYDDEEHLNSFLNIIFNQTVLRTSPSQVGFIYYDPKYLGELFTPYQKMPCMSIFNNVSDVSDSVTACIEEVNFRREVMSPYGGIEAYNEYLVGQDCVPETEYFIFNCYPEVQNLSSENQKQLIVNGAKYGYRQLLFINNAELNSSNKKSFEDLLEIIGKIYCITENAVKKRSRVFYQAKLEEL